MVVVVWVTRRRCLPPVRICGWRVDCGADVAELCIARVVLDARDGRAGIDRLSAIGAIAFGKDIGKSV